MAIATTIVISKGVDVGNQRQDGEETGSRLARRTLKFNHHYSFSYLEGCSLSQLYLSLKSALSLGHALTKAHSGCGPQSHG